MNRRSYVGKSNPNWKGGRKLHGEGYIQILKPEHSRADKRGYVFEHILVAEKKLGRSLKPEEVVHYDDENRANNDWYNLIICDSQYYHMQLHKRRRALKACGHADWLKCRYCGEYDDTKNMYIEPDGRHAWHRNCRNKFLREQRKHR